MTYETLQFAEVIKETEALIAEHFKAIDELLNDSELERIVTKYEQYRKEHKISGFNIFNLISDKYYYENLHSDIISAFLNPIGEHQEGDKFLKILIELIQKLKPEFEIIKSDFSDVCVTREKYHIDILIQDQKTNKAIIIENKINNAQDTYKQLPTYVSVVGKENIAGIVYLPLESNKHPDQTDWTEDEIIFIDTKIISIPAYNRTENDFFNGWLLSCIREAGNEDTKAILKQYSKLIQKLGGFIMDKSLYSKFYDKSVSEKDFFKSSLSVKEFVDNLHFYRAEKIKDYFIKDYSPFKKFVQSGSVVTFEGYQNGNRTFRIHLNILLDKYELKFWDEKWEEIINEEKANIRFTKQIIDKLQKIEFEEQRIDEYVKWFSFPEEEQKLYDYINELKSELKKLPEICYD